MQIDKIFYPVTSLGYGKRIGIWTVGCPHKCPYCSNPELWEKDEAKDINIETIINFIRSINGEINGVTITGGEPFFQFKELIFLLKTLNKIGITDILLYSGYTLDEIISKGYSSAFKYAAALADGRYIKDLNNNIGLAGSENQKLILFKREFSERYSSFSEQSRKIQSIVSNGVLHTIGIPLKK